MLGIPLGVVGVSVGDDEAAKERAADALRASDARFLNYYADNYVEDLSGDCLLYTSDAADEL